MKVLISQIILKESEKIPIRFLSPPIFNLPKTRVSYPSLKKSMSNRIKNGAITSIPNTAKKLKI
jgi:hypothetical protein